LYGDVYGNESDNNNINNDSLQTFVKIYSVSSRTESDLAGG